MEQKSRIKNSVRNISYRLISEIINIILKFVNRYVFILILGISYNGINGLFSEILNLLALAEMGVGTAFVFSMYKPLATGDEATLSRLMAFYKKVYTYIALAVSAIGIAIIPILHLIVNLDEGIPHLYLYYLLYLANTAVSYLFVYRTSIFNADQKAYVISKYNTIFTIIFSALGSLILWFTNSFIIYLLIQIAVTIAKNYFCSREAVKRYPFITKNYGKLSVKAGKNIFSNIKSVFIYKLSVTLVTSVDNTLISIMIGTAAVGFYSNYNMVIANITLFVNIIFTSVTASIGNLVVENNASKNYKVYKIMQAASFIICTFAVITVYALINDFISVWLGEAFKLDIPSVIAIVLNLYLGIVLMPIWSYREAVGLYRQTKYVMLATAIINLGLSIILGHFFGLAGILFATSIARLVTYFWYEPKLLFSKFFKRRVRRYYISITANAAITLGLTAAVVGIFHFWVPTSWGLFILKFIIVVVTAALASYIVYRKLPGIKYLKGLVIGRIKR